MLLFWLGPPQQAHMFLGTLSHRKIRYLHPKPRWYTDGDKTLGVGRIYPCKTSSSHRRKTTKVGIISTPCAARQLTCKLCVALRCPRRHNYGSKGRKSICTLTMDGIARSLVVHHICNPTFQPKDESISTRERPSVIPESSTLK